MRDLIARLQPHEHRALAEAFQLIGRDAGDGELFMLFNRAGVFRPATNLSRLLVRGCPSPTSGRSSRSIAGDTRTTGRQR